MAGLSSSTTKRGGRNLSQQANSNEMAEILRAWDDEDDEMVEYMQSSKADRENLSSAAARNANGSAAVSRGSPKVAIYSPSTVRVAKTICLYVSFFGLVSKILELFWYYTCDCSYSSRTYTTRFNEH